MTKKEIIKKLMGWGYSESEAKGIASAYLEGRECGLECVLDYCYLSNKSSKMAVKDIVFNAMKRS